MTVAAAQIIVAREESAFFRRAVDLFVIAVRKSAEPSVALSGGSTPKKLFELLAAPEASAQVAWDRVRFFWGDERCVPPEHADSNFRMAQESLLSKLPVDAARVHRMRGELDPQKAAAEYEQVMSAALPGRPWPKLDFVLLGMGDDGHTASLFPGTAALEENTRWVTANRVEKLNASRLTFTFPLINHARRIVVMVAGAAKAGVLGEIFSGAGKYPIERVSPIDGELIWLLDAAAAGALPASARSGATYI